MSIHHFLKILMFGSSEDTNSRHFSLKEKDVKQIRIDDVRTLYEIYEFQEEIGHGTFGIVISAFEKSTNINYAIKIVNKYSATASKLKAVKGEMQILKTVSHPNIINLHKIYETSKKIYMIFERCNDNLLNVFKQKYPFSEKINRKIVKQIVSAVYYLHKNDIVHRDIKMENVLLATNPNDTLDEYFIKLTDFGLSVKKTSSGIQGLLKEQCGTIVYMAPEILLQHAYSELCDVWSIGVIIYMLLFGKYPFHATQDNELVCKICHKEPDYSKSDHINLDVIDLIKSCLIKDPVSRISALEMLKHPWLMDNKVKCRKNENVIDYMKKWKKEMMLPGEDCDWVSVSFKPTESGNFFSSKSSPITGKLSGPAFDKPNVRTEQLSIITNITNRPTFTSQNVE